MNLSVEVFVVVVGCTCVSDFVCVQTQPQLLVQNVSMQASVQWLKHKPLYITAMMI